MSNTVATIPEGMPKSGRSWKSKQRTRSSSQIRKGVLRHMASTFEERQLKASHAAETRALEKDIKDKTKALRIERKEKQQEMAKRRQANELKNSSYQVIDPTKMKHMNKKQLRMIKKTIVNKDGQVSIYHDVLESIPFHNFIVCNCAG